MLVRFCKDDYVLYNEYIEDVQGLLMASKEAKSISLQAVNGRDKEYYNDLRYDYCEMCTEEINGETKTVLILVFTAI